MALRCPDARILGVAALHGHHFFITTNQWASVRPDDRSMVWGLLWQLSSRDFGTLDRWEDVENGLYTRETRRVIPRKGSPCEAFVYVERSREDGTPRSWYMDRIIASAARHRLPEEYQLTLCAWRP